MWDFGCLTIHQWQFLPSGIRQESILWPVAENRKSVSVSLVYLLLSVIILAFLLPNQTWACSPMHSKASLLSWAVLKKGAALTAGRQARSPGEVPLKTPEPIPRRQQSILKSDLNFHIKIQTAILTRGNSYCLIPS